MNKNPNQMNRRRFLETGAGAGIGAILASPWISSALAAERMRDGIEGLFESDDPQLIRMAADVMCNCVLAKIKAPEGTAKRRWLQAGTGDAFYGQWIWDTNAVGYP